MSLNNKPGLEKSATELARTLRKKATPAERILWEALRAKRLRGLSFYRQKPFYHDLSGRESYFIADFYCHQGRLVIELDGGIHKGQIKEDEDRTRILNLLGLTVIRFTNQQVENDLQAVLRAIVLASSSSSMRHSAIQD